MPSLESALQSAITRHVRRELAGVRKELAVLRKAVERAARTGAAASSGKAGPRGGRRTAGTLKADRIRAIRARLGVSQALFAKMTGVTPVAVYYWESGRTTPSVERERILLRLEKKAAAARVPKSRRRKR